MESIFTKSMMKLNPNGKELVDLLSFVPLLQIKNGRMVLDPKGLKVLQSQVLGSVHLIALEGDRQSLLYNFYKKNHIINQLGQQRQFSGIWISSFPRYDRNTETQYLFLQTAAANQDQRIKIHCVCTLICSAILVGMSDPNLWYLASIEGRIVFSRGFSSEREDKQARRRELSSLVLYSLESGQMGGQQMVCSHNEIYDFLNERKIYLECQSTYKGLNMLRISGQRIENQDWEYVEALENQLRVICNSELKKNEDLLSGPILRWYLQAIVQSFNTAQNVEIERCLKNIQVTDGYNAFLRGVEVYHSRMRREMKEQGVPNLREVLQIAREQALQQYKKTSFDAEYLIYLGDYIDAKDGRLTEQNNKIFDIKNINYLKMQSEQLLARVVQEKMSQATAQEQIEKFSQRYREKAMGDNRFELLSNYLKYLNGAVYAQV